MSKLTHEIAEQMTERNTIRELTNISQGQAASDGDGVKLTRLIGNQQLNMLDPFLLLDLFESDQPNDYIGDFPAHPHRGFETITYMLTGKMRHKMKNQISLKVLKNQSYDKYQTAY